MSLVNNINHVLIVKMFLCMYNRKN